MAALRADLLAPLKPKVDRAISAESLKPALDLLSPLREVAVLEYGATGSFEETGPVLKALGTHALELIVRELSSKQAQIEELNAAANELVLTSGSISGRGLHTDERNELVSTCDYLRRIESVAREGGRIAHLLGGDVGAWESIVSDAGNQVIRIESILNRPG